MEFEQLCQISCDILIVGGGVAGISCFEEIQALSPDLSVILLTACDYVKQVSHHRKLTRTIEEIQIEEKDVSSLPESSSSSKILVGSLKRVDTIGHVAITSDKRRILYKKLNICTGGLPNKISTHPLVLAIRDIESIIHLQKKISGARRVIVVGNGGIALEFVYGLRNCEIVWVIKDDAIGNVFLDKAAADFLLRSMEINENEKVKDTDDDIIVNNVSKRERYKMEEYKSLESKGQDGVVGASLGPDWKSRITLEGMHQSTSDSHSLQIEYSCEVKGIFSSDKTQHPDDSSKTYLEPWPLKVELTNGNVHGADLVLSATGVVPNTAFEVSPDGFRLGEDHGIIVDSNMRTSIEDIYASGDVCSAGWKDSNQWFQMRLWTQARQMGIYSARCIVGDLLGDDVVQDFCFEMFAHLTTFFGFKVVLLGNYNGQGLDRDFEILVRKTEGKEYVKAVIKQGRVVGALLIGETDLEETFENLILNRIDVSRFGESLLDPSIDIEDYFD